MSIRKLILQMLSLILFTDALGSSIGSFNLYMDRIWNYILSVDILNYIIIDYLEFFTMILQLLVLEWEDNLTTEHALT